MPKKRIMHKFRMTEISSVDNPAQAGAKMVIMKRDDESDENLAKRMFDEILAGIEVQETIHEAMEDMWKYNEALRSSIVQIVSNKDEYPDPMSSVKESVSQFISAVSSLFEETSTTIDEEVDKQAPTKSEGGKQYHAGDYAYVPDSSKPSTWKLRLTNTPGGAPDPRIVGAAAAALGPGFRGQKVQIPSGDRAKVVSRVRSAWLKANPGKSREDLPAVLKSEKEGNMPVPKKGETDVTVESLTNDLEKVNTELQIAKAYGKLTDAEKSHYETLGEEAQGDFLGMTSEQRAAEINKSEGSNPVVYTAADGMEFRKNDDARLIAMAKRADANEKIAKEERAERKNLEISKRVDDEVPNVPGDRAVKVALYKAIDGIEDEDTRKGAYAMLKAHNELVKLSLETNGERPTEVLKAEDALEKGAREYMKTHQVKTYEKAYAEFLETPEGQALYVQVTEPATA